MTHPSARRWLGFLLIAGGLVLLTFPLVSALRARSAQAALLAETPAVATTPTVAAALPAGSPWPKTRLAIPALELELAVQEGSDPARLRSGPVHLPDTALPGALTGRVAIAGHNNTCGSPFRDLNKLSPGESLYLATPQGTFCYSVDELKIVGPDDLDGYIDTTEAGLLLITCYPYWHPTHRLLVLASLAGRLAR